MLKKRIIGVVTVKNGWAVQSFGYHRYLPLGKPECLVENFNRWGADEILVQVIDRSMAGVGPDYELLGKLARLGLGTPLIYAGGIRTVDEGVRVIQSGADRFSVDTLLHEDLSVVLGLSDRLGAQAVIASLPMGIGTNGLEWFNYRSKVSAPVSVALVEAIEAGKVSEVLLTDWRHEGSPTGFDSALIDLFQCKKAKLILFGGISCADQMKRLLIHSNVVAVSVGNFLSYREHAIQQFKEELASAALRPAAYTTEYSLPAYV
jgi:imidazole glycerol-phosphate synthase subunit HisF